MSTWSARVFSLMEGMLPEYGLFGWVRQPQGAAITTAAPTNTYPCADGKWLCIAGNSDLIFRRLMAAIGRPDAGRRSALRHQRPALRQCRASWTPPSPPGPGRGPRAEAEAILEAAEVPCSRLYDMRDCAEDPHFRARELVMQVEDPLLGPVLHPAAPFRFDGVAPRDMVRWTGPAAGAHNDHVFHELPKEDAPMTERVELSEVAPRDGLQSIGAFVPTETKIALVRASLRGRAAPDGGGQLRLAPRHPADGRYRRGAEGGQAARRAGMHGAGAQPAAASRRR